MSLGGPAPYEQAAVVHAWPRPQRRSRFGPLRWSPAAALGRGSMAAGLQTRNCGVCRLAGTDVAPASSSTPEMIAPTPIELAADVRARASPQAFGEVVRAPGAAACTRLQTPCKPALASRQLPPTEDGSADVRRAAFPSTKGGRPCLPCCLARWPSFKQWRQVAWRGLAAGEERAASTLQACRRHTAAPSGRSEPKWLLRSMGSHLLHGGA